MKKIFKFLLSRLVIVCLLILIQFLFLIWIMVFLSDNGVYFYSLMQLVSVGVVLYIITNHENPSYKLAWVIPILIFPLFGGFFYLLWGNKPVTKKLKRRIEDFYYDTEKYMQQDKQIKKDFSNDNKGNLVQTNYIFRMSGFPIYKNTEAEYFPLGDDMLPRLTEELKKAEKFILMEYFIIQEGIMWNHILEILKQKAASGVEVYLMYDDIGCIQTLPAGYHKKLASYGIKVTVFNPFKPQLTVMMNYRDHRKICVIDGNIGFCGGINLADEYINAYEKYGHWKDTAVMLKGDAVKSLTLMFMQLWQFTRNEKLDFEKFKPTMQFKTDGYVQPFGDSPMDNYNVAENAYLQMINRASKYVYITTPYLILDNEMVTALSIAAQSGVDVRIITPHKADKWYVHAVTQAYYLPLLKAGVKIYEYTPGFMHAKMFVSDDNLAIVGTTNMDYRSFYLHFECGVLFFGSQIVEAVKCDVMKTIEKSQLITHDMAIKVPMFKKFIRSLLRIFSPLM